MSTLATHPRRGIAIWHCQPCRVIQIEDITDLASLGARKAAHDHTISHRIRAWIARVRRHPMGMFDRFIDAEGRQWQTKALACYLDRYEIGDPLSDVKSLPIQGDMQIEAITNGLNPRGLTTGYAIVRDGRLVGVQRAPDPHLPLIAYSGGEIPIPKEAPDA